MLGVHQAPDGKMWFNSGADPISNLSISYFDGVEWGHFTEGIFGNAMSTILSARDGKVWFSRDNGLYVYDGKKVSQVEGYSQPQDDIMESSDGQI